MLRRPCCPLAVPPGSQPLGEAVTMQQPSICRPQAWPERAAGAPLRQRRWQSRPPTFLIRVRWRAMRASPSYAQPSGRPRLPSNSCTSWPTERRGPAQGGQKGRHRVARSWAAVLLGTASAMNKAGQHRSCLWTGGPDMRGCSLPAGRPSVLACRLVMQLTHRLTSPRVGLRNAHPLTSLQPACAAQLQLPCPLLGAGCHAGELAVSRARVFDRVPALQSGTRGRHPHCQQLPVTQLQHPPLAVASAAATSVQQPLQKQRPGALSLPPASAQPPHHQIDEEPCMSPLRLAAIVLLPIHLPSSTQVGSCTSS